MSREPSVLLARNGEFSVVQFTVFQRPWTTNGERRGNRWDRASQTAEWRSLFGWLARSRPLPQLTQVACIVALTLKGRLQDTAACNPAVKAAIDGLVDGGLLVDDTPEHLLSVTFMSPERGDNDRITLVLIGRHKQN